MSSSRAPSLSLASMAGSGVAGWGGMGPPPGRRRCCSAVRPLRLCASLCLCVRTLLRLGSGSPHEASDGHVSRGVRGPVGPTRQRDTGGGRLAHRRFRFRLPWALVSRAFHSFPAAQNLARHRQVGTDRSPGPHVGGLRWKSAGCGAPARSRQGLASQTNGDLSPLLPPSSTRNHTERGKKKKSLFFFLSFLGQILVLGLC